MVSEEAQSFLDFEIPSVLLTHVFFKIDFAFSCWLYSAYLLGNTPCADITVMPEFNASMGEPMKS